MEKKKVSVVTGGSGFVGSHLVDLLINEGHEVRCIVRKSSSLKWLQNKDVKIFDCGLFDREKLAELLKDADYLYHIAGVVKAKTEEGYYKGNVETTRTLLEALENSGNKNIQRVVIMSSQTACGPSLNGEVCNEETIPHPITTYGRSKRAQEELALTYKDKFPITITRAPAVYGERDTEIYLVFKTYKQGLLTVIGFDKKELSLIHVADLVRGVYEASLSEKAIGEIYFVSSEEFYTWEVVGNELAKVFGKKAITLKLPHFIVYTVAAIAQFFAMFSSKPATFNLEKARDFVQSYWTCDVSKAKRDFGYSQKVSLSEGLKRTISWYKEMKWL